MDETARRSLAARNHGSGYTCSQAVYCAFRDVTGISEPDARAKAMPYSGGRKIKCGALCAAELVIDDLAGKISADGRDPDEMKALLEKRFAEKRGSVNCREIRAGGYKNCRASVEDAAGLLESLLRENEMI